MNIKLFLTKGIISLAILTSISFAVPADMGVDVNLPSDFKYDDKILEELGLASRDNLTNFMIRVQEFGYHLGVLAHKKLEGKDEDLYREMGSFDNNLERFLYNKAEEVRKSTEGKNSYLEKLFPYLSKKLQEKYDLGKSNKSKEAMENSLNYLRYIFSDVKNKYKFVYR